eukprot:gene11444-19444_t
MEHIAYDEQEAWEYDEAEEGTYYTEEVNDDDDGDDDDDDDDDELDDPQVSMKEACATGACKKLSEILSSKTATTETCLEEFQDFVYCVDHCVAKDLFHHLK